MDFLLNPEFFIPMLLICWYCQWVDPKFIWFHLFLKSEFVHVPNSYTQLGISKWRMTPDLGDKPDVYSRQTDLHFYFVFLLDLDIENIVFLLVVLFVEKISLTKADISLLVWIKFDWSACNFKLVSLKSQKFLIELCCNSTPLLSINSKTESKRA